MKNWIPILFFCFSRFSYSDSAIVLSNALNQSYLHESQGNILLAIESLSDLYRSSPKDYFLNLRLGWLFRRYRSYLNAKEHYLAAEKADPNALDPQLGLFYLFVENDM